MTKSEMKALVATAAAEVAKEHKPRSFDGFISGGSKLNAAIATLGVNYDPSNTDITGIKIGLKQTEIIRVNATVLDTINPEKDALLARNTGYDMMDSLTTDSLNIFKSGKDVAKAQVKIASGLAKGVYSIRIIAIKDAVPTPPVTGSAMATVTTAEEAEVNKIRRNSVSEQQFGSRSGNFLAYITYITAQTCYNTNDARLKATALKTYHGGLALLNSTAEAAIYASTMARAARNEAFFNNTTGARFLFTQVKKYFASFGAKSVENKLVKGIPFPNLIKKAKRTPTTDY